MKSALQVSDFAEIWIFEMVTFKEFRTAAVGLHKKQFRAG